MLNDSPNVKHSDREQLMWYYNGTIGTNAKGFRFTEYLLHVVEW